MRYLPACVLCLVLPPLAFAARTAPTDHPVSVRLEVTQPTAIALPEPVASVSVGIAPERFSLDYDGPYLFLLPLDPTVSGRLFIVGHSGTLYTVLFKVASPADDVVSLVSAARTSTAAPFTTASFLRALRTGTAIPGQTADDLPPPTLPDSRLTVLSTTTVRIGTQLGQVLTIKNTDLQPVALDVRIGQPDARSEAGAVAMSTWTFPPRLTIKAVATEHEQLAPGTEGRIYLIFERR
jgi:hypothetical protein